MTATAPSRIVMTGFIENTPPHGRRGRGDAPAALEVFERIQQGDDVNPALHALELVRNLVHAAPARGQAQGVSREYLRAQGVVERIHDAHAALKIRRGYHRALVRAGELRGDCQADHLVPVRRQALEGLGEVRGRGLARRRKGVALYKPLVKALGRYIHAVHKVLAAEVHVQPDDLNARELQLLRCKIKGGVHQYPKRHIILSRIQC